jgi:hypothetical protein
MPLDPAAAGEAWAWRFRYPGVSGSLSTEEAAEALSVARNVYDRISVLVGGSTD